LTDPSDDSKEGMPRRKVKLKRILLDKEDWEDPKLGSLVSEISSLASHENRYNGSSSPATSS